MGRIYFNLNNQKINYLEEDMATAYDMVLADMSKKLVLASLNNIKEFECFDPQRKNESVIKNLIKNGYKPVNKLMELIITQNYSFCPNCGNDIDIEQDTTILITDAGTKLSNLIDKNTYPAKEIVCTECNNQGLYYYDLFADNNERNAFAQRAIENGAEIFVRYKFVVDGGYKHATIPVVFDFSQLLQLFKHEKVIKTEMGTLITDYENELRKGNDRKIISMLFNKELHEIMESDECDLVDNVRVELKPVELGNYAKYVTKKDFEQIKMYEQIGSNQEELLQLIKG